MTSFPKPIRSPKAPRPIPRKTYRVVVKVRKCSDCGHSMLDHTRDHTLPGERWLCHRDRCSSSAACYHAVKPAAIPRKARVKKRRGTKRAALVRACDKLWGELVRGRSACIGEIYEFNTHKCKGPIQAMHGLSRRYQGTRWDLGNGFAGCAGIHLRFTKEPMAWTRWLIERWGLIGYDNMWKQAQAGKPKDLAAVLSALQARKALEGP